DHANVSNKTLVSREAGRPGALVEKTIDQELPGAPSKELSAGRSDLRGNRGYGKISTKSAEIQTQTGVQIVTCSVIKISESFIIQHA
ncbi:hypothetical protein LB506_000225, partial [Fusarium annulatum]